MAHVTVALVDSLKLGDFYFTQDAAGLARKYLEQGLYETVCELDIPYNSFDAAEEVFDLTNNPMRMDRRSRYGNARSVSVGDLVTVDGVIHLCRPNGWVVVDMSLV